MVPTEEHVNAPTAVAFDVVADADWYPEWLVGAQHIRGIDDDWPRPGSAFHHVVGVGPLRVKGSTSVLGIERPRTLELRAGIGPFGAARVRFTLDPEGSGTRITVEEEPDRGVIRVLWSTPLRKLLALGLWCRNAVSLEAMRDRIELVAQC
jgi:carbon monoxide dehydrogenase subunit G